MLSLLFTSAFLWIALQAVQVSVPNATFDGVTLPNGINQFIGIKYADVPTRFRLSQMVSYSSPASFNATQYGPNCYQITLAPSSAPMSEQCLYLNIWTPTINSSSKLPVMVWIHGGSFTTGSGASSLYNGTYLATQNVVYVTINYRLGAIGFLSMTAISQEMIKQGIPSNGGANGIYDQVLALRWVNKYISAFGGDPSQVTVQGESAGGLSVCLHTMIPLSKGLLQRAIVQSGSCTGPWGPVPPASASTIIQGLFAKSNLTQNLTELRTMSPIVLLQKLPMIIYNVDGYVIPNHPFTIMSNKSMVLNVKEVIYGVTTVDTLTALPLNTAPKPQTPAQLKSYISQYISNNQTVATLFQTYYKSAPSALEEWYQINADVCLVCPTLGIASQALMLMTRPAVFVYSFGGPAAPFKATHAAELPFVFNDAASAPIFSITWNGTYAVEMIRKFTQFAKTGNPNWTPHSTNQSAMFFRATQETKANALALMGNGACMYWTLNVHALVQSNICQYTLPLVVPTTVKPMNNATSTTKMVTPSTTKMVTSSTTKYNPPCDVPESRLVDLQSGTASDRVRGYVMLNSTHFVVVMSGPTNVWFGFGFGSTGKMQGSQALVFSGSNVAKMYDLKASPRAASALSASSQPVVLTTAISNGVRRVCVVGKRGSVTNLDGTTVKAIWARGRTTTLGGHTLPDSSGSTPINLNINTTTTTKPSLACRSHFSYLLLVVTVISLLIHF